MVDSPLEARRLVLMLGVLVPEEGPRTVQEVKGKVVIYIISAYLCRCMACIC